MELLQYFGRKVSRGRYSFFSGNVLSEEFEWFRIQVEGGLLEHKNKSSSSFKVQNFMTN
jgi:hypothetical protein